MVEPVGYAQAMQLMMQFQRSKEAQLVFPAQVIVQLFAMMGQGEKMASCGRVANLDFPASYDD